MLEILDDVDVAHESDGDVAMAATFHQSRNAMNALQLRLTVALPSAQHWIPMPGPLSTLTA